MRRAAFAGRDAADHLGAVGDGLLGMERALVPVKPWQITLVFLSTRMDMYLRSRLHGFDDFLRRVGEVVGRR